MTKRRATPPEDQTNLPEQVDPLEGLIVQGVVTRRRKRVLDSGSEVVSYDISGVTVQVFNPTTFHAIGEWIAVNVTVAVYTSKSGPRYSLNMVGGSDEGDF